MMHLKLLFQLRQGIARWNAWQEQAEEGKSDGGRANLQMRGLLATLVFVLCFTLVSCQSAPPTRSAATPTRGTTSPGLTYADYGQQATTRMLANFYTHGKWKICLSGCGASNQDWGADSLTYTLFLRWQIAAHDPSVEPFLQTLAETAPVYPSACQTPQKCRLWSDEPLWDSIALGREYEATGQREAPLLARERAAFDVVDGAPSSVYALCAHDDKFGAETQC